MDSDGLSAEVFKLIPSGFWKITVSYRRKQGEIEYDMYRIVIMYSFAYFVHVRVDELIIILSGLFLTASLWNYLHVISVFSTLNFRQPEL